MHKQKNRKPEYYSEEETIKPEGNLKKCSRNMVKYEKEMESDEDENLHQFFP